MTIVLINPNSTEAMTEGMLAAARRAAPGLAFEGWTSRDGPPAIQGEADGLAAEAPLLALVAEAVAQGATGVIVGCFDDTALARAAAVAPAIPVVGIGQAAFHYAALRHWRFSVVTTLSVSVPILRNNIADYGLAGWLGRVRASKVPVLDLERDPEAAAVRILDEAQRAVAEDGIQALVLGCGGMVRVSALVAEALPIPVIDPMVAAARGMMWLREGATLDA